MKHFDNKTAADYDLDIRSRIPGYDLIQELISAVLDVEVQAALIKKSRVSPAFNNN